MKTSIIVIFITIAISFFSCKTEEIILHGNLAGTVTDAESGIPVQSATVILSSTQERKNTGPEGLFIFKNLDPKEYELQASKAGYSPAKQNVQVTAAETREVNFSLIGVPVPRFSSKCLDLGLDSASITFTISNEGAGTFSYLITKDPDWISITPSSGEVKNETDNIRITVNKANLSRSVYNEILVVTSSGPGVLRKDTLHLNLNGVADIVCNYYKVVKIGDQTWMAENLNIGQMIPVYQDPNENGIIEKWCYDCTIYGGLYNWYEAMNYSPLDTGDIGTTQGICPVGWHLPTAKEVAKLSNFLSGPDGEEYTGGKLKAISPLWKEPNYGATNESGFTALPGGTVSLPFITNGYFNESPYSRFFDGAGSFSSFWTSDFDPDFVYSVVDPHPIEAGGSFAQSNNGTLLGNGIGTPAKGGSSVRCVKNPNSNP